MIYTAVFIIICIKYSLSSIDNDDEFRGFKRAIELRDGAQERWKIDYDRLIRGYGRGYFTINITNPEFVEGGARYRKGNYTGIEEEIEVLQEMEKWSYINSYIELSRVHKFPGYDKICSYNLRDGINNSDNVGGRNDDDISLSVYGGKCKRESFRRLHKKFELHIRSKEHSTFGLLSGMDTNTIVSMYSGKEMLRIRDYSVQIRGEMLRICLFSEMHEGELSGSSDEVCSSLGSQDKIYNSNSDKYVNFDTTLSFSLINQINTRYEWLQSEFNSNSYLCNYIQYLDGFNITGKCERIVDEIGYNIHIIDIDGNGVKSAFRAKVNNQVYYGTFCSQSTCQNFPVDGSDVKPWFNDDKNIATKIFNKFELVTNQLMGIYSLVDGGSGSNWGLFMLYNDPESGIDFKGPAISLGKELDDPRPIDNTDITCSQYELKLGPNCKSMTLVFKGVCTTMVSCGGLAYLDVEMINREMEGVVRFTAVEKTYSMNTVGVTSHGHPNACSNIAVTTSDASIVAGVPSILNSEPCSCNGPSNVLLPDSLEYINENYNCYVKFKDEFGGGFLRSSDAEEFIGSVIFNVEGYNGLFSGVIGKSCGNFKVMAPTTSSDYRIYKLSGTKCETDDCVKAISDDISWHIYNDGICILMNRLTDEVMDAYTYGISKGYRIDSVDKETGPVLEHRKYYGSSCNGVLSSKVVTSKITHSLYGENRCNFCVQSGSVLGTVMRKPDCIVTTIEGTPVALTSILNEGGCHPLIYETERVNGDACFYKENLCTSNITDPSNIEFECYEEGSFDLVKRAVCLNRCDDVFEDDNIVIDIVNKSVNKFSFYEHNNETYLAYVDIDGKKFVLSQTGDNENIKRVRTSEINNDFYVIGLVNTTSPRYSSSYIGSYYINFHQADNSFMEKYLANYDVEVNFISNSHIYKYKQLNKYREQEYDNINLITIGHNVTKCTTNSIINDYILPDVKGDCTDDFRFIIKGAYDPNLMEKVDPSICFDGMSAAVSCYEYDGKRMLTINADPIDTDTMCKIHNCRGKAADFTLPYCWSEVKCDAYSVSTENCKASLLEYVSTCRETTSVKTTIESTTTTEITTNLLTTTSLQSETTSLQDTTTTSIDDKRGLEKCKFSYKFFSYNVQTNECLDIGPVIMKRDKYNRDLKDLANDGCSIECLGSYMFIRSEREKLCVNDKTNVKWSGKLSINNLCNNKDSLISNCINTDCEDRISSYIDNTAIIDSFGDFAIIGDKDDIYLDRPYETNIRQYKRIISKHCSNSRIVSCTGGLYSYDNDIIFEQEINNRTCSISCDSSSIFTGDDGLIQISVSPGKYVKYENNVYISRILPDIINCDIKCKKEKSGIYMCDDTCGKQGIRCFSYTDMAICYDKMGVYRYNSNSNAKFISITDHKGVESNNTKYIIYPKVEYSNNIYRLDEFYTECVSINDIMFITKFGLFGPYMMTEDGLSVVKTVCKMAKLTKLEKVEKIGMIYNIKRHLNNRNWDLFSDNCGKIKTDREMNCGIGPMFPTSQYFSFIGYQNTSFEVNGKDLRFKGEIITCGVNSICRDFYRDVEETNTILYIVITISVSLMFGLVPTVLRIYYFIIGLIWREKWYKIKVRVLTMQNAYNGDTSFRKINHNWWNGRTYKYLVRGFGDLEENVIASSPCRLTYKEQYEELIKCVWEGMSMLRRIQYYIMVVFPPYIYLVIWLEMIWFLLFGLPVMIFVWITRGRPSINKVQEEEERIGYDADEFKEKYNKKKYKFDKLNISIPSINSVSKIRLNTKFYKGDDNHNNPLRLVLLIWLIFVGKVGSIAIDVVTSCNNGICTSAVVVNDRLPAHGESNCWMTNLVDRDTHDQIGYLQVCFLDVVFTDIGSYLYSVPSAVETRHCSVSTDTKDCADNENCAIFWDIKDIDGTAGSLVHSQCNTLAESSLFNGLVNYKATVEQDGNDGFCAAAAAPDPTWSTVGRVYEMHGQEYKGKIKVDYSIMDEVVSFEADVEVDDFIYSWGKDNKNQIQINRVASDKKFDVVGEKFGCYFPGTNIGEYCAVGYDGINLEPKILKYFGEGNNQWHSVVGEEPEVDCMDGVTGGDVTCTCTISNKWDIISPEEWALYGESFGTGDCKLEVLTSNNGVITEGTWCKDPSKKDEASCSTIELPRSYKWIKNNAVADKVITMKRSKCNDYDFDFQMEFFTEYSSDYEENILEANDINGEISGCYGSANGVKLCFYSGEAGKMYMKKGNVIKEWDGYISASETCIMGTVEEKYDSYYVTILNPKTMVKEDLVLEAKEITECETITDGDGGHGDIIIDDDETTDDWPWWYYLLIGVFSLIALIIIIIILVMLLRASQSRSKRD